MPFDDTLFIACWPTINRNIHWLLRSMHCRAADREDISQEIALQLFVRQTPFSGADDLSNYALAAAKNRYISLLRGERTTVDLNDADRLPGLPRVDTTVEHRLALEAAYREIRKLNPEQRELLDDVPAEPNDRRRAQDEKGPKYRLRQRIRKAIGGLLTISALAAALLQSHCQPYGSLRAHPKLAVAGRTTSRTGSRPHE